jgi:hypothetical protein
MAARHMSPATRPAEHFFGKALPATVTSLSQYAKIVLASDPNQRQDEANMRFHLTYEGPLFGSSTNSPRARHKQEIRKVFHRQLRNLWEKTWLREAIYGAWEESPTIDARTPLNEALASLYRRGNYRFVPLVREQFTLLCSLEILFLRADVPGGVVQSGDIDNRLKTLFDALRMPQNDAEVGNYVVPEGGEDPFYCLLEDDKLISHVSVATDMLLEPIQGTIHDARLVIDVRVSPYRVSWANIGFAS